MAKIDLPYEINNLSPANAVPVQSNFARIEQHTNAELIERGGTVAMTAQLRLAGNPMNGLDAAPKQYVDTIIPIGGVIMYTGPAAPVGGIWLVCDGSPAATADYPDLFAVMGTRFGGSGGFFNLPPLTERFPVGAGTNIAVGAQGGSKDAVVVSHGHVMTHDHGGAVSGNENQAHNHNGADHAHAAGGLSAAGVGDHQHAVPVAGAGFLVDGVSGTEAGIQIGGSGYSITPFTTLGGAHGHGIVGGTALADRSLVTGNENQTHNHNVAVPAFSGSTQATGVTAVGANMPPYVGIIFIVRAV